MWREGERVLGHVPSDPERSPPKGPLTDLETLRDAFSVPPFPRHRPYPLNLRHWNWCPGVRVEGRSDYQLTVVICLTWRKGDLCLDSPKVSDHSLYSRLGEAEMFYLLLLFMGPGSSSRGPPLPTLGLWVGKSEVWLQMCYKCLPLDGILALLGHHWGSIQEEPGDESWVSGCHVRKALECLPQQPNLRPGLSLCVFSLPLSLFLCCQTPIGSFFPRSSR